MIRKAIVIFCENEHGAGDVCFPNLAVMDLHEIEQHFIDGPTLGVLRDRAKAAGWRRVNGGDFCPHCAESM